MTGFTYKNRHSSEFGIIVKTSLRPIIPEEKSELVSLSSFDGTLDLSSANPYGRPFYNDRIFEMILTMTAPTLEDLEKKVSSAAVWLMGRGDLIFDDMPAVIWNASIITGAGFAPKYFGKAAQFTAVFRVKPFSKHILSSLSELYLSKKIPIGEPVPLAGFAYIYTFSLLPGNNTVRFLNIGNRPSRPVFIFSMDSPVSSVSISCGSNSISVADINLTDISLDFSIQKAMSGDDSITNHIKGDFFEFPAGFSEFTVTCQKSGTLKIDFTPEFVYNSDIDEEALISC